MYGTKYSFPSKTLEYMSSGTPVLTSKLSGIPSEYYDYLYVIEDRGKESIKKAIEEVFDKSEEELISTGILAKNYVLNFKNCKTQTKKILDQLANGDEKLRIKDVNK